MAVSLPGWNFPGSSDNHPQMPTTRADDRPDAELVRRAAAGERDAFAAIYERYRTGVYRFVPGKGPAEELVSFHCKPRWGKAAERFTTAATRSPSGPPVLTEYQFAGDTEAHGVPTKAH